MHEQQREQTHELLAARGMRRALFSTPATVTWLTGLATPLWLPYNAFAPAPPLLWYEEGHFTLLLPDSWAGMAAPFGKQPGCTVLTYTCYTPDAPIAAAEHLAAALRQVARASVGGVPAIEARSLPLYLRESLLDEHAGEPVTLDEWLPSLRASKTAEEVEKLRANFALTDTGHLAAEGALREGVTELELWHTVYAAVQNAARQAEPVLLGNDVTVGRRAHLGGPPSETPVAPGDSFVLDLGTRYLGYRGDSCATTYAGEPSPEQAKRHRTVAAALEEAIALVRPGARASEIDRQARRVIEKAGYPVYPHHTGHGIGITSHEAPWITPYNDEPLREGMVIMLEPAIYLPGECGVRLEEAVLVTQDGTRVLTGYKKGLP